ncbi:MAG: hypothetical protein ACREQ9_14760 [Candidatus Binatia bacterium]
MIPELVIAAELVFATGPYAPPLDHPVTADFVEFLDSAENVLTPVLFQGATSEACRAFYRNLYDGSDLDVRIAFGYMDAPADEGPIVVDGTDYGLNYALDGHARSAFTSWIQRPCEGSERLCGFRARPEDPDLYVKELGPEAENHREVRVRVTHASAAPFHVRNVEGGDQHDVQSQLTHVAEANFLGGLGQADAVFYVGHARGGGGPDFAPPILRGDRHVNYDGYYRRVKPGVKKLLHFLANAQKPAKVISLLSCKATGLFVDRFRLEMIASESMFVTAPNLTGYKAILLTTVVIFDSLLNGRCLTEIRSMLDRVETFATVGGRPQPLSELIHFDGIAPIN